MKKAVITISYDPRDSQSEELASQEISETMSGLLNSLRTQVNGVQVSVKFQNTNKEK